MEERIESMIASFSPTTLVMWLIFFYNRATNIAAPYITQAQKTAEAVKKSLYTDSILCFYESIYIPVLYENSIGSNVAYAETPRWYYYDGTMYNTLDTLLKRDQLPTYPWLAADIVCDGQKVADITDFVGSLHYTGDMPPTPAYILGLWSYKNNLLLKRTHTQLVVIDREADTHTFNFSHTDADDPSWLKSICL